MRKKRIRMRLHRDGTAVVEFAVLLPLVVLIVLGAVELGRGVMTCHILQEAAQAGCRVYSVEETTVAQTETVINEALNRAGITNPTITYVPQTKAEIDTTLEPVTVTISVPYLDVAWISPSFLAGATMQGRCTMPAHLTDSSVP